MKQPEALLLADALDDEFAQGRISNHNGRKAAVELRRLALKQWVGLTGDEARIFYDKYTDREELIYAIDKFLEEKNNG
jgi:hypothetical protein